MTPLVQTFKPERRLGLVWIFLASFGLFVMIGLIMLWSRPTTGLIFIGFGSGFILLTLMAANSVRSYVLTEQELILKRWIKTKRISRGSIEQLQVVSAQDIKDLLAPMQDKEIEASNRGDISGAFKARKEAGKLTEFLSLPIVYHESSAGHELNIVNTGVHIKGQGILIITRQDDYYLISPRNIKGLLDSLN